MKFTGAWGMPYLWGSHFPGFMLAFQASTKYEAVLVSQKPFNYSSILCSLVITFARLHGSGFVVVCARFRRRELRT